MEMFSKLIMLLGMGVNPKPPILSASGMNIQQVCSITYAT